MDRDPSPARGHARADAAAGDERRLLWALGLTAGFAVVEIAGGILTGSMALLADAGHMATDAAALGLAYTAARVSRRASDARRSFGYHRFQVLAAFVNGAALLAMVALIAVEAVRRLAEPVVVAGEGVVAVAAAGLIVNVAAYALLHGGDASLNRRAAATHVLSDMLGSAAALIAGAVILWTGWTPIDPLLSILIALLILRSAVELVRRSTHILLEGTPDWIDVPALKAALVEAVPGVVDIHHVHAWLLTSERPLMTLHARVRPDADRDAVLRAIAGHLRGAFGVGHVTVQVEGDRCPEAPAPGGGAAA